MVTQIYLYLQFHTVNITLLQCIQIAQVITIFNGIYRYLQGLLLPPQQYMDCINWERMVRMYTDMRMDIGSHNMAYNVRMDGGSQNMAHNMQVYDASTYILL
jgi:hypothetical protein